MIHHGSRHALPLALWRFSASVRALAALLISLALLLSSTSATSPSAVILLAYNVWAGLLLWQTIQHGVHRARLWHYWIDVLWSLSMLQHTTVHHLLVTITLLHPVVMASVAYRVRDGVSLALCAATLGTLTTVWAMDASLAVTSERAFPLLVLALVPVAAAIARPMTELRQQHVLRTHIEADFDPRCGLDSTAAHLVEAIGHSVEASLVALVLPSALGRPAWMRRDQAPLSRLSAERQQALQAVLAELPPVALSWQPERCFGWLGGVQTDGQHPPSPREVAALERLGTLLQSRCHAVVPLLRHGEVRGHVLLSTTTSPIPVGDIAAVTHATSEMQRLLETAHLVDQLQEEGAANERLRIGRDLHDSAIQPYLGVKYAIEGLALRTPVDSPIRADMDALLTLVQGEIRHLSNLISDMRTGHPDAQGDNALVPAVRRQAERFSRMFDIEVEVHSPGRLPTSRTLASAIFHMVNEALNNVRKHTTARHVRITLEQRGQMIHLRVRDNAGTLLGHPLPDFSPVSLSERAAELGGHLHLTRPDGLDTELLICIPA